MVFAMRFRHTGYDHPVNVTGSATKQCVFEQDAETQLMPSYHARTAGARRGAL